MISLTHYLILSAAVFCIGLWGILTRRNAVSLLLSSELILNSVNINLVAFSRYIPSAGLTGQIFAVFVIAIAAAEAAVGLAIVMNVYRTIKGVDLTKINLMKG